MCTLMIASALAGCLGGDDEEPVVEEVMGCMDPGANNYNSAATADDGSCDYGRAHADTMTDYAAGTIDVQQAMYELEVSRKCREQGQNNPCEVVLMSIGDASTIDPHDAYDSASGDVIEQVYDTLYRYAGDGTGNAIIEPRLATGYSMSEDGKTYTFTLRDDVYFSNGDHMTAEDVVYSWERVNEYGAPESHVAWITQQNFETSGLTMIET